MGLLPLSNSDGASCSLSLYKKACFYSTGLFMCEDPGWKALSPRCSCCVCYNGTFQPIHAACRKPKGHGAPIPPVGSRASDLVLGPLTCFVSPCAGFEQGVTPGTCRGPFQHKLFSASLWVSEWASAFVSLSTTEKKEWRQVHAEHFAWQG